MGLGHSALSLQLFYEAVACHDGTLWCYQIAFSTVHGLYKDRHAYSENTDVIIQHLTTGNKVRIKCHDRVQKIAIYKHRLAVQLPERVVVYEQGDMEGMLYRVKEKLPQKTECSLLVATSDSLLLCQDTKIIMIGRRNPRSWSVPTAVRYVKVTTLLFEEVLLLGLLNGQIWQVEPKSGACRMLLQTPGSVRCFDVNATRLRVAVVDETSVCRVYSLPTGDLLYTEENVSSVSWNSWCEELICFSGGGLLSIKAGQFAAAGQPVAGSVVGFQGGRVFCLQSNSVQTINVPLSHAVHQYCHHKMFAEAYAVACLGVTWSDWERLGFAALEEISLEVARKAFQRGENIVWLTLIDQLQERVDSGENRNLILGEILSYRGRYKEAAQAYRSLGRDDKALDLYVDLRMFNKAQELVADSEGNASLARRRAEWARHVSEPRAAAHMYLAAGDIKRAVSLMAHSGPTDMLIELSRKLDKGSSESLRLVAEALVSVGEFTAAADCYQRQGDYRKVAQLAVKCNEWSRAFALARDHAECKRDVYLPYAHRMAHQNNFVDAQRAYHMAGETATAMRVFTVLLNNAVAEERFTDAAYLHHLLAAQHLDTAAADLRESAHYLEQYHKNERLARIYHAYESVHRCVHEPFSLSQPETLFNAARFVLALLDGPPPPGVSIFCLYLCLAKQAKVLNVASLARQMLDKILALQIPQKFQESVELLILKTQASVEGGEPQEDVSALCWRCRRHAPPLAAHRCPHCTHAMVHALPSHEVLPLVQFEPDEGIAEEEAMTLIERTPLPEDGGMDLHSGADLLRIDSETDTDVFLVKYDEMDVQEKSVVVCSRNALIQLNPGSVVCVRRPPPLPTLFYRNMLPELPVTSCPTCYNLFYMEDFEIQTVSKGFCPFCRQVQNQTQSDVLETSSEPSSPSSPNH